MPPVDPRQANANVPGSLASTVGATGNSGNIGVPLPPARPPIEDTGNPYAGGMPIQPPGGNPRPPLDISVNGPGGPGQPLPPNATPAAYSPPIPPASAMPQPGAPTASTTGSLAGMLGINPDRLRAGMAGVGRGFTAVGNAPAGATAGQMVGRGLGGSLTGVADAQEKQKTELFNQSSTAFKDMLAAKTADNTQAYRTAQSQYLTARAQSLMTGGTGGSRAWQNTDYGKTIQVENEAQKYEKGQQILLQKKWSLNATSPDDQKKDLDQLGKNVDAYRGRLYKQIGVDPNKADKLKDMGTSATNPFDTKGMTVEQFHQMVPMGGWFKDQNGVVRQRTVPPPGSGAQPSAAAPGAATNYDDLTAMQPAA